ncbi:hypothetical protein HOY80DRAFT_938861, partial [Tuber brumale]
MGLFILARLLIYTSVYLFARDITSSSPLFAVMYLLTLRHTFVHSASINLSVGCPFVFVLAMHPGASQSREWYGSALKKEAYGHGSGAREGGVWQP